MTREGENGTDAGSESRSKIYFDYAEQQGGKDREVGLKLKTVRTYPLRHFVPRPPILEGQRGLSVIPHFLPLRQGAKRVVRRMTETKFDA